MPSPAIYFENTLAVITQESRGRYVRVRWKRVLWDLLAGQEAMNSLLECLLYSGWKKVLIKQPPLRGFPLSYHTWLLYDWLPRAQMLGTVSYALIPPQDLSAHVGFADFLSQLHRFKICYFVANSREQAVAWLNSQSTD
ncbi:hypothetical protein [Hymenobacter metallilatus]|uniref:STAS/SEC14 domain-containing protein n=1 Tax=Hymenobacter metallilatus TaxID=2493666 RepID=A0A3R9LP64_9BACT|nr:hypothetical protein [Hymenobacter metallilatus]RSK23954.1 hypothetical protein EI290_21440 [Hymenobacter metallilatus]